MGREVPREESGAAMKRIPRTRVLPVLLAVATATAMAGPARAEPTQPDAPPGGTTRVEGADAVFEPGWRRSGDRVWTAAGDGDGFHVLVAEAGADYAWRTAATLSEPGLEADTWVGNACVTGSGDRVVVVYAPRAFANKPVLAGRGGFTAVVDLRSGAVVKLPVRTSLAHYNPGCGVGETAVVSQEGDEDLRATRLLEVDATTGRVGAPIEVPGQLTSPVPTAAGIVAADDGALVRVAPDGARTSLAAARGVPFSLRPDAEGGVVFLERAGEEAVVRRARGGAATTLATGPLTRIGLVAAPAGRVFITGGATATGPLPPPVGGLDEPRGTGVSSTGRVLVLPADGRPATPPGPAGAHPLRLVVKALATGRSRSDTVVPGAEPLPGGGTRAEDPPAPASPRAGSPSDPVEAERSCAIQRNDPRLQVLQPTPRQVEWTANYAVLGQLPAQRAMFPLPPLRGGGRVPAQVLLGILAQESNLWQASRVVMAGQTGNPLIGNYYGRHGGGWDIDWVEADCGYGVSQMTDGMRMAGREKPGQSPALPHDKQLAIATDYEANVAAGLQLLHHKWNELHAAHMNVNGGNPNRLESWFFAAWSYNSGFHPYEKREENGNNGAWGLGWFNNPGNPRYDQGRGSFGADPRDPSHPLDWPYPEKALGFAAFPVWGFEGPNAPVPGFRGGGWINDDARLHVKPPPHIFCRAEPPSKDNNCHWGTLTKPNHPDVIGEPAGPCQHRDPTGRYDLKCWVNFSVGGTGPHGVEWKDCTKEEYNLCGQEFLRFTLKDGRQPNGQGYRPRCGSGAAAGLPEGALVVDDVPDDVRPASVPDCPRSPNAGRFSFDFAGKGNGTYPSKVDTHQIGGGYGAHFWFAHTWDDRRSATMRVTGTWALDRPIHGWARVLVHIPDHGAHTQQATYRVDRGNGDVRQRVLLQRTEAHEWVSLGVFEFAGMPKVSLSNFTRDNDHHKEGGGVEDVAWDAVAWQPLAAKPRHQIVALGDSYASGEGAGGVKGEFFHRETDNNGRNDHRNACHRSKLGWPRHGRLSGHGGADIAAMAELPAVDMDFHFLACSGAKAHNLYPSPRTGQATPPRDSRGRTGAGMYRERSQIDRGFLDENTTLVSLSVGGNDAGFSSVIKECVAGGLGPCFESVMPGESEPLSAALPKRLTDHVLPSVTTALTEIEKAAPNARIVLMGYSPMFEPDGGCLTLLSVAETNWLNEMAALMRDALTAAVAAANQRGADVSYVDPTPQLAGHRICAAESAINTIVISFTPGDAGLPEPSAQSFHPNALGVRLLADAYSLQLERMGL